MKAGKVFYAGVVGGLATTLVLAVARMAGLEANLEGMLGTLILPPQSEPWIAGFAIHLLVSGLVGLAYGWGFERLVHRAGAPVGAAFGLIHGVLSGLVLGALPSIHPRMPELVPAPGAFLSNLGAVGVIAELGMHVLFGAIVGAMYGPVLHPLRHARSRHVHA